MERSVQRHSRKENDPVTRPRQTKPNSSARREASPPGRNPRQTPMRRGSTSVGPGTGPTGPLNNTDRREQTSHQPSKRRRKRTVHGSPSPLRSPRDSNIHVAHGPGLQPLATKASKAGNERRPSRREDSEDGEDGDGDECGLCGEDLRGQPGHRCQDCAALFCPACVVNAALLHPGHSIQATTDGRSRTVVPRGGESVQPEENTTADYECNICLRKLLDVRHECQTCPDGYTLCANCVDIHPAHHHLQVVGCGAPDSAAVSKPPTRDPSPATTYECVVCEEQLSDLRYECQTCNVSLCHLCQGRRGLHPTEHKLKAIRREFMSHASDKDDDDVDSDEGNGGATTTSYTRNVLLEDYVGFDGESDEPGTDAEEGSGSGTRDNRSRQDSEESSQAEGDTDADQWPRDPPLRRSQRVSQQPASVPEHPKTSPRDPGKRPRGRPRSTRSLETVQSREDDFVVLTREQFQQFSDIARAILRAGNTSDVDIESVARPHGVEQSNDLLRFNLNGHGRPPRPAGRADSASGHRRWTDDDKRRLGSLKRRGLDDLQIAAELDRTPGAVSQQWRKQYE